MSFPYQVENTMNVEALLVDSVNIFYRCPNCVYRKKAVTHCHGSCGNYLKNRIEGRTPHCCANQGYSNVDIHITDNTIKKKVVTKKDLKNIY